MHILLYLVEHSQCGVSSEDKTIDNMGANDVRDPLTLSNVSSLRNETLLLLELSLCGHQPSRGSLVSAFISAGTGIFSLFAEV